MRQHSSSIDAMVAGWAFKLPIASYRKFTRVYCVLRIPPTANPCTIKRRVRKGRYASLSSLPHWPASETGLEQQQKVESRAADSRTRTTRVSNVVVS